MKLFVEILIFVLLPLATFGSDSRLYHHHSSNPYQQPPRPHYPSPQREDYYPPLAQHPQPNYTCCRSNYPEEYGSCRVNADCTQRVSPYCSGFGYCTQITQYGEGGCSPCEKIYHQR